jgi:hypothetical protein
MKLFGKSSVVSGVFLGMMIKEQKVQVSDTTKLPWETKAETKKKTSWI